MPGRLYASYEKGGLVVKILIIMLLSFAIGFGTNYYFYGGKAPCVKLIEFKGKK